MIEKPERFATLASLFQQAEVQLKQAEEIDRNLTIPAVNELRYVAFHLIRALSEQGRDGFDSDIERAENHAKRAIYDATEASILALLEKAEVYQLEFRSLECTTEVLPNYVDLLKRLESARRGIAQVRATEEHYLNRQQYYPEVLGYISGLRDLVATLEQADPLIRMKSRKRAVHFYLMVASLVAAILGILISLALFLLQ
ncbi:hypothetical protein CKO25_10630 [Thiocapsa imhoffii]|uniref:Uncharacterized protein n=1 Tax=Thiocapsa imhoffii TaxID=382777 RepID=A0A9X0WIA3_9GAMM|nr:hypothetical protein [Thiocapsa imhoffii]MBK1645098.1 hypothetical protein [Thiocapsa imhoffii]